MYHTATAVKTTSENVNCTLKSDVGLIRGHPSSATGCLQRDCHEASSSPLDGRRTISSEKWLVLQSLQIRPAENPAASGTRIDGRLRRRRAGGWCHAATP